MLTESEEFCEIEFEEDREGRKLESAQAIYQRFVAPVEVGYCSWLPTGSEIVI